MCWSWRWAPPLDGLVRWSRTWPARRWSDSSRESTRTSPRIFCALVVCGRGSCFGPTTTRPSRRWSRRGWASRWRRSSPSMRTTPRCGCCRSPSRFLRAYWAWCGTAIDTGRPRQRLSWRRRSPSHRRSSARMRDCLLGLSGRVVRAHRDVQLETVDLVVLRPDLDETECAHDRERGCVGWRDRCENFRFTPRECILDEGLRRLFRESLASKRSEDRVADLGAADDVGRSMETAVADHLAIRARDDQAGHPAAAVGRGLHAVELDGEEARELAGRREFIRQLDSQDVLRLRAIALDEVLHGGRVERHELEPRRADGCDHAGVTLIRWAGSWFRSS